MIFTATSCKKQNTDEVPGDPASARKVRYLLYSDKDLSGDQNAITFTLSIQNSNNQTLWDSVLTTIKIKDIPDLAHKFVVEKTVPGNDNSLLKVGFYYSIENIGNSWHLDAFDAGAIFKTVDFNFQ